MYLKTVLVILGAGHPKKGHKNHKADVGSVHPGLLRGETKGLCPWLSPSVEMDPAVIASGLQVTPITGLVR